ncbi:hypothetical protein LCGC14_0624140 [marine sediment metagenome]|uniref:Uncharacterized protein n=1 Tax=marine sediment metagenome TaxID=412755 RepID=A0A0F9TQF4_9ZZZZ
MKRCNKCKAKKLLSEFTKDRSKKEGLKFWCRTCCAEYKRKYVQTDASKVSRKKRDKKSYATIPGYLRCVFSSMKRRCNNPEIHNYNRYGGRGIKVLFKSSKEFIKYVVNELQIDPRGLTIDRIDNDGNYEPGNIRFVSQAENNQNQNCKELLLV